MSREIYLDYAMSFPLQMEGWLCLVPQRKKYTDFAWASQRDATFYCSESKNKR